ncbi:hypothetical protein DPM13_12510 [Paracoccus mutanolyticus]|uniref:Uncharacterized protein n=1 Tax=Paracoccus mutanolyticus TaxID=1499308 RepID=A0ABN5M9D4_9RHOB|nr:hypothetical protein DPM13_12510 [Paracoccus mutanolyticus]
MAGGLANTIAGRIANHFDLHGGAWTVDGAPAASWRSRTRTMRCPRGFCSRPCRQSVPACTTRPRTAPV